MTQHILYNTFYLTLRYEIVVKGNKGRIIETENTKVLSSFISSDPLDDSKIKLTLKLDKPELRHIKATLERFGYKILDHYQEETGVSSEEDRIGNLLRFLDI